MICPQCKHEVDDRDRFCSNCRTRLSGENCGDNSGYSIREDIVSGDVTNAGLPIIQKDMTLSSDFKMRQNMLADTLHGDESQNFWESQTYSSDARQRKEATIYEMPSESDLAAFPISFEYAINRFILAGGNVNLELRIDKRRSALFTVEAWLVFSIGKQREIVYVDRNWMTNGNCLLNIVPYALKDRNVYGDLLVECYAVCHFADKTEYYTFHVRHAIIAAGQQANNLNTTISLDGGALMKDVDLSSLYGNNGDQLIACLNREPALFRPVSFQVTDWRPEDFWIDDSMEYRRFPCDKLTLEYGDILIHLCAKDEILFGRSFSRNDIVICDWSSESAFRGERSMTVSSCHGKLEYHQDSVCYEDCSSYGTMINTLHHRKVVHKGTETSRIKLPENGSISFGCIKMKFSIQSCLMRKNNKLCINCRNNPCSSMMLQRYDDLPEVFLFVWECCSLWSFDPSLKGITIYRRNNGFVLSLPNGEVFNLYPGLNIRLGQGNTIVVDRFYQPCY